MWRGFWGSNNSFSYMDAVKQYGLEQFAQAMSLIVVAKFSSDASRPMQVLQFLREEAEAMSKAGGYPSQFARKLFKNESDFMGAMQEDALYPIDYPGGPQQTLLTMTLDFMRETNLKTDLPARFRCAVVGAIAEREPTNLAMCFSENIDWEKVQELQKKVDVADDILGELLKEHKSYFKKFMPSKSR